MFEWEKIRHKTKIHEIIVGCISVAVIIGGLYLKILNNSYQDFSLTLLQILATITTLTLSVIALLSGTIVDSYMGVSVSSYYLEKRPYYLKQKVVIVIEFILLVISITLHIFELYNMVLSLFIVSIILIMISIFEIFEIFKGKKNTVDEIEGYIKFIFSKDSDFPKYGELFVEDWKSIVADQSAEEFDRYYKDFIILIERILTDEKNMKSINSICSSMALFLLENENGSCRKRGIQFVDEVYRNIWIWISMNKAESREIEGRMQLFDIVFREWYKSMKSLDAEIIEEVLEWNSISELVIRVASYIGFSQDSSRSEAYSINSIARTFGEYINEQNKKGNLINVRKWENILRQGYYSANSIPKEASRYYKEALAVRDFNVCYGYIFSGNLEMIKNAVFLEEINNLYSLDDWDSVYRIMLIHCFLYYLAYREDKDCIDESLQKDIRAFLNDEKIIKSVKHFCDLLVAKIDVLSSELENKLEKTLMNYEPFPKHSNFKSIKIDKAVREYFMFLSLICVRSTFENEKLYELYEVDKYSSYLMRSKNDTLKKRFKELYSIFTIKNNDKNKCDIRINELIATFDQVISKKYKNKLLETAAVKQRQYEKNEIQSKTEKRIREVVLNQYKTLFREFCINYKMVKRYNNVQIFTIVDYTRCLTEEPRQYYLECAIGNIFNWLLNGLINDFGVKYIKREEAFSSDEMFREYIRVNEYDTLLGEHYIFNSHNYDDYDDYKIHTDFINERKCVFVPMANAGIAMKGKAFGISIDDVAVDILSPTLNEIDTIKRNNKSGAYIYEPISGMPIEFEEKEIREYLHDDQKIIKISISASISLSDKNQCVIIS